MMDAHAFDDASFSTDTLLGDVAPPHVLTRWDSQQASPRQTEAAKLAKAPAQDSHGHSRRRSEAKDARRKRLQAPGRLDGCSTAPLAMAGDTHDDESADEEIVSGRADALWQKQRNDSNASDDADRASSKWLTTPSRNQDVEEIGQWYFACQLPEHDIEFFRSVQDNWVKDMWQMGQNSEPIFSVLGAFALHKKALLGGPQARPEYIEQKGKIIQNIVSDLRRHPSGPDPSTIVAMAILAYLDIRDNQLDASGTHLQAVAKFVDMSAIPVQGWLYCTWIDLRQALFTSQEPSLPFYVPVPFRELPSSLRNYQREAFRLGGLNASQCPRSSVFTLDMASDMFGKLHALCHCSEIPPPGETPPFGQVYALEYGLRVIQARAKRNGEGDVLTAPIMLITSAIQLHVWMASRFYTPQARETHLGLIKVATETMAGFDDMVTQWYIAAGLESLLWVLFTLLASLHAHELPQTNEVLGLLYKALRMARINTCEDLEKRLRSWPWLENWHPVQIDTVWQMLGGRYPDLVPRIAPTQNVAGAAQDPNKARHRWFLGGLEFYNSL